MGLQNRFHNTLLGQAMKISMAHGASSMIASRSSDQTGREEHLWSGIGRWEMVVPCDGSVSYTHLRAHETDS